MDIAKKSLTMLSLCTGIRGLERGIERALEGSGLEIDVVTYVEIEAFIIANLIAGMEAGVLDPRPVWANLKTFPWEQFRNKIHLFVGGYPCQPFSTAGKREGTEDPRHLWPYIKKGIRAVRPACCFFENVRGHLSLGFDQVYADLQGLGYEVRFGIYSAEEVGAPHKRERLFIMAIMADATGERLEGSRRRSEESAKPKSWNYLFPSRPEEEQYDWEEPRVIEPGVGFTVDGYNFREDLLRAAGNGVVEQTAELAFIDLLSKF